MTQRIVNKSGGTGVYNAKIVNKSVPSYKKGGKVKKTGLAKLHKGEIVIPASEVSKSPSQSPKSFWNQATGGRFGK